MVPVASATAAALAALCAYVSRHRLPDSWAHPVLTAIVLVSAAASMLHLYLAADDRLTSNTMLALVGAGAFVLDRRWLAIAAAGVWVLWAAAILAVPVPSGPLHWVLGMAGATLLGLVVGALRRSGIDRLSDLVVRAERAAVEDGLTGLLNRRGLAIVGDQVVASARRSGNAVHCVFVDVDG